MCAKTCSRLLLLHPIFVFSRGSYTLAHSAFEKLNMSPGRICKSPASPSRIPSRFIPHVPNKTYVRERTMTHAEPSAKQNMMHCLIQTLTNNKTKTRSWSSSHPKIQSSALFENAEHIQDSIQKRTTSRRCTDPKMQTLRHGVD